MSRSYSMISSTEPGQLFSELAPWLIVLLLVATVGGVAIAIIRRSTNADARNAGQDYTLQGLRDMHAQGLISDEEFERAKATMIGRIRAATSENTGEGGTEKDVDSPA